MEKKTLMLIIGGLDVQDAKQLAKIVMEIAKKDPSKYYTCTIGGLENKPVEEVQKILREVFTQGGIAS